MAVNILLKRSSTANKRPTAASMQYGELNLNYDATTGGVFYKDSNNNVVKVGPCQVGTEPPNLFPAGSSGNSRGEFWYNNGDNTLYVYDGSMWLPAGSANGIQEITGEGSIIVDNTDPINPVISAVVATTVGNEGVVQLSNAINGNDTTGWAATPFAVKLANDNANTKLSKEDGGTMLGNITMGVGTTIFFNGNSSQLVGVTSSTSTTSANLAASATAVKSAYDLANAALPKAGGTFTGAVTFAAGQTFPIEGIQVATTAQLGVVQVGTNIDVAAGVISVADASTSGKGVVELYDGTDSTSTTLALTANQGKNLQDQIDALSVVSNLTLAGTYNATTGEVDSVTADGAAAGFVVGDDVPAAAAGNTDYFLIIDVAGSVGPAGTAPYHIGDWFLSDGSAWQFLNVGFQASAATTTNEGVVYLATDAEVQAGTETGNKAINPASLQSKISDSTSTTDSYSIASSTAVKAAYDAADQAQTDAAAAMLVADDALPKAGGTITGPLVFGNGTVYLEFFGGGQLVGMSYDPTFTGNQYAASATAVNSVYNVAQAALPKSGGTMTGTIVFDPAQTFPGTGVPDATTTQKGVVQIGTNIDVAAGVISVADATTSAKGVVQLEDSTSSPSVTTAATPNSVRSAYDLASAALPKAGGTITGDLIISGGGIGIAFNDGSALQAVSDSTSLSNSSIAASTVAVKAAYDLAAAALPAGGGSVSGDITFSGAGEGVVFADSSKIEGITDSVSTTDSNVAASATAVQTAYDAGVQGQTDAAAAQTTADAALPKAGGTMTGDITFFDSGEGVVFANASKIHSISDSTSTTDSDVAASATAVKSAYDLAADAVPQSVVTAKGDILVGTASGVVGVQAAGTNGQFLVADSATASGLAYTDTVDGGTF